MIKLLIKHLRGPSTDLQYLQLVKNFNKDLVRLPICIPTL